MARECTAPVGEHGSYERRACPPPDPRPRAVAHDTVTTMKPSEIYAMDPVSVSTELYWPLDAHSHVPDVCLSDIPEGANTRVTVCEIDSHYFDDRRSWGLGSVWLDGCPVMIVQNAGGW
jgi:hypothetical protein